MEEIQTKKIGTGEIGIWWLGQAGYIIKSRNKIICIDPYLSDSGRQIGEGFVRMVPVPIEPEELVCDLFLCTHNHSDHTDPETIKRFKNKESTIFVGPRKACETFLKEGVSPAKIVRLDVGEEKEVSEIKITGTFCVPNEETVLDSEGFILSLKDEISLYFTGDTAYTKLLGYLTKYRIDIMFTCINGKLGNMGVEDSIRLTETIKPKIVVPNHYGMFAANNADPNEFKNKGPELNCQILNIGEIYLYQNKETTRRAEG